MPYYVLQITQLSNEPQIYLGTILRVVGLRRYHIPVMRLPRYSDSHRITLFLVIPFIE